MAQILIRLKPAPPKVAASAILQERTGKRPGMIVYIADDSHEWGTEELGPKFGVLNLPGAPLNRVQSLMLPELVDATDEIDFNILDLVRVQKYKRSRRWEFLMDEAEIALPGIQAELRDNPTVLIKTQAVVSGHRYTWGQIRAHIVDHQTGAREQRNF